MKSRRTPMSLEEYHRLPFSLVWKQEYFNGELVETPRDVVVHATIPVAPRNFSATTRLRPTRAGDERALLPSFRSGFSGAFEFCDYTRKRLENAAQQSLQHFFHGPFHRPLSASRVALGPTGRPIGAALVLEQDSGWALLDMIFVAPAWQRGGVASALASAVLTGLNELGGYDTLVSRYHFGNDSSRAWHHHFGFVDEPDLRLAQLQLRAASQELRRQRELGPVNPQQQQELVQQRERWLHEVNRLESLVKEGREEEADPWRKWRRKT